MTHDYIVKIRIQIEHSMAETMEEKKSYLNE